MKLFSILKYQFTQKEHLHTSSIPMVLKLNLEDNTMVISTLDLLTTMESVKLNQSPTFVSRLGVLACKYHKNGDIHKFQVHMHKKDLEEVARIVRAIFGVNWRLKASSSSKNNENTQQMLEHTNSTQPLSGMLTQDIDSSLRFSSNKPSLDESKPKVIEKMSVSSQTDSVQELVFNLDDFKGLAENPKFGEFVDSMGNEFIFQYYACL
eukprot:NODE_477_length_7951_cov_0.254075.p3 type:complete len:208 gc:universal NODE_477_length_7951_cov_0.254075:7427-6804(-)